MLVAEMPFCLWERLQSRLYGPRPSRL